MGLKPYRSEGVGVGDELGETMRAYTPGDPPTRRRTTTAEFAVMIAIALLLAGVIALWPPSSTTELAAAPETATAPAPDTKSPCAGQTWPYLSNECLSRRAR